MKLSNREKIMLALLGLILLVGLYYNFIWKNQNEKLQQLQKQASAYNQKILQLKTNIAADNKVYKDLKIVDSKARYATAAFFPSIIQEKLITMLEDMINNSGLQAEAIAFSNEVTDAADKAANQDTTSTNLLEELKKVYLGLNFIKIDKKETAKPASDNSALLNNVERMTSTITFTGTYENITAFIAEVEKQNRHILIDKLTCVKAEGNLVNGTIILDFYAIPKMHQQDEDYLLWSYLNNYGKDNPFLTYDGYNSQSTLPSDIQTTAQTIDFFASVKPITSDIPSVILGKNGDLTAKTYVYADNSAYENVEIQLLQKDDKYFYRYRTQNESYPASYDEMTEFVPYGENINIDILSSKRNGANDINGVNMTILNSTRLKTVVTVKFDDKANNRIKFVKTSGDVVINRTLEE